MPSTGTSNICLIRETGEARRMTAVHLRVHGRVTGVFYRASAHEAASALGVTGWVRNQSSDCVEIHAEGDKEPLEQFIVWCRRGPAMAKVTSVDREWVAPKGLASFEIRQL